MSGTAPHTAYQFDRNLAFAEDLTMTGSGIVQLSSADVIVKLGPGRQFATLIVNLQALEVGTNDDIYKLVLEGSDSATLASGVVPLAALIVGHTTPLSAVYGAGAYATSTIGRYEIPFTNQRNGVVYDYLRLNMVMAGTGKTITFDAWIALNSNGG